jgi:hypothetical protein
MESKPRSKSRPKLGAWRNVASARRLIGRLRVRSYAAMLSVLAALSLTNAARADEGGVSFWIPGLFGSLAAAPQVPGWAIAAFNYYDAVRAGGTVAAARQVTIGRFNPTVNDNLNANLKANPDLVFVNPTYVFATPVFGGQFAVGMLAGAGRSIASINGTLTATAGPLTLTRQGTIEDARDGFSDIVPLATLRWNNGVNNWMTYITGDIPVGMYNSASLANIGLGHGAIDGGVSYTYFDPKTGHEFSATTGVTYNLVNPATGYQNGVDWHLDWGASQFMTKQLQLGLVGYFYRQLSADQGCLPQLCPFESQVIGVGPQIGYLFPVAGMQGYINLKGYGEFDGVDRPHGYNVWLTLSLSPAPPSAQPSPPAMLTKAPPRS